MGISLLLKQSVLAVMVAAFLIPAAMAQDDDMTAQAEQNMKKHVKEVPLFPNATRTNPKEGVSSTDMDQGITKLLGLVNASKNYDGAIALGTKLAAAHDANHYDRSVVYEAIGYAYLDKQDTANGIEFLRKAIVENGLSNNEHYELMVQLARAQLAAGQTDAGLATLDRVVAETKLDKPEYDGIRGRVYYMKKDYANAAPALQKSLQGSAKPDPNEQQMLLVSYSELKQPERAVTVAEQIAHAHPDDKAAVMNLAATYQQSNQPDKTLAVLDDARKRGLLTTAEDYRKLYVLYSNLKGHESESITVINEGLQKSILQPNEEVYTVLAEDYYFTSQFPQALDAYKKADAVSTDGEAALNMAKIYNNQGRMDDAKEAAERALQKGVKNPADAHGIIDRAGKNPAKKK